VSAVDFRTIVDQPPCFVFIPCYINIHLSI